MSIDSAPGLIPQWTIGDRLRKARELVGLDQQQMAAAIGVSRNSRDLRLVQDQMGHASPKTTAIYTRPDALTGRVALGDWETALGAA